MRLPLTGVVPPMVTPLRGRDELDVGGMEQLIEHIVGGGVAGLFILGTTGEGPSLSYRLRREVIDCTCRQVRGRVPVLVGITDTSFIESLEIARHAADAGADAVVLAPPYYFFTGQPELHEYLDHLITELPLPVYLYNAPHNTKVQYELGALRQAMEKRQVLGVKDSSKNLTYFEHVVGLVKQRPDWSLFVGPEELLSDAVLAGGHGGVPGGANVFPKLYVQLCEAARVGDISRARELQAQVMRISNSLYNIGRHPSAIIKGIKCALSCQGVCDDFMAEPFHRFRAEERAQVERCLDALESQVEQVLANHHPTARAPAASYTASK